MLKSQEHQEPRKRNQPKRKSNEIKQFRAELKEDETKTSGLDLKKVPHFIKESLEELAEHEKEVQDKYDELLNYKEGEN